MFVGILMYCTARAIQWQVGDANVSLCLFTVSVSVTTPIRTVQTLVQALESQGFVLQSFSHQPPFPKVGHVSPQELQEAREDTEGK